MNFNQVHTVS